MGTCFIIIGLMIAFFISVLLKSLLSLLTKKTTHQLPPGPFAIPFIGNLFWLHKPFPQIMALAPTLHSKYGPIYTLRVGSKPIIIIGSHSLAHQALIVQGAVFSDRPPAPASEKLFSCDQHNITSAFHGPTWLLFRRNLVSNILHSSKIKSYACARKWAIQILIDDLKSQSDFVDNGIQVMEPIQHAIFCLLVYMCFGQKLERKQIKDIRDVQRRVLLSFNRSKMINLFPRFGKIFFHQSWKELLTLRKDQEETLVPLIRARRALKDKNICQESFLPYVDTLFDLNLPEQKRKLEEKEIVTLCSEFFTGGTDTTATSLQWIMANLVKYQHIQDKLFEEIKGVIGDGEVEIKEDDLRKMPYLRAVILEGLRRHPPSLFLVPHSVTKDVLLHGFLVPKDSVVTLTVGEMGRDPKVWENPMEFKPERFLNGDDGEAFDFTGRKEIKMMPFGVGRRMCPAYNLAMLHLEYFVANLVWHFKWSNLKGHDVDLTEKHEFTSVMQNSLQVHITPRLHVN
ncbi:Cytochrome P450 - like 10 [Theobroma cacao]|nr:Cytochrome P450 - like 10 [Theobroma cacao]WRX23759.1 Cytochrome P450 - like 10 [Theobroma cacao]